MQCVRWCCAVCELWCNWARPPPGLEGTDTKAPREKSGEGGGRGGGRDMETNKEEEEEEEEEGVVFLGIAEEGK